MTGADTEQRLRAALRARAESVEATGTLEALERRVVAARAATARRRVVLLGSAAAVVLVALAVGGVMLVRDDNQPTEVQSQPTTTETQTPTTAAPTVRADSVIAIWPPAGTVFANPAEARRTFLADFLQVSGNADIDVELANVEDRGWVVTGATSDAITVAGPQPGDTVGNTVSIAGTAHSDVVVEVRSLGEPTVLGTTTAAAGDFEVDVAFDPAGRAEVAVVVHEPGVTATVVPVRVEPATTAPTAPEPADTGVQGWPGSTSRQFDSPESAAVAFATDVLGFADPTVADTTEDVVAVRPRPTAGATTLIEVHDTGARGWVVLGATSDQGFVDEPVANAAVAASGAVTIRGQATAFEAHVVLEIRSLSGELLSEGFTTSLEGNTLAPFEGELVNAAEPGSLGFVLIGDSDASGEGRMNWAVAVPVRFE